MELIGVIFRVIMAVFTACYFYQYIYIIISLFKRSKIEKSDLKNKFAILICARNEENVIENCVKSLISQEYPSELVKIFVVADNCTDNTARIAREAGATVYERFNAENVGKGYALEFLFSKIASDYGDFADAYLVFDADNIIDSKFVDSMNDMYVAGYNVATCYRNTKNYSDSPIAACSGLWFLRDSRYLNEARMVINTGCSVSGTGFMVSRKYLERIGGWHFHTLIEDTQFSVECALNEERIGYCKNAVVYDEQPVKFRTSCRQRLRWCKGYYQLFAIYGFKLMAKALRGSFTCFDMFMNFSPAYFLSLIAQLVFVVGLFVSFFTGQMDYLMVLRSVGKLLLGAYGTFFIMGLVTTITEWKRIHASTFQKLVAVILLPVFMETYLPITAAALFARAQWKPIEHLSRKTKDDFIQNT